MQHRMSDRHLFHLSDLVRIVEVGVTVVYPRRARTQPITKKDSTYTHATNIKTRHAISKFTSFGVNVDPNMAQSWFLKVRLRLHQPRPGRVGLGEGVSLSKRILRL